MSRERKIIPLFPSTDCAPEFAGALQELAGIAGEKVLRLTFGKYIFKKSNSAAVYFPVSNTVVRSDSLIKHIGLLIENMDNLIIDGNGAELIFDGDMSAIALRNCHNVRLENFSINFIHPRVSEMKVVKCGENFAEFSIDPSSRYSADENGRFCWINADGLVESFTSHQVVQVSSPENTSNLRTIFNPVREALDFETLPDGHVLFKYGKTPPVKPGETWQFRDPSRRENGIMITHCSKINIESLRLGFTPGLGIVAQMTRDLSIRNHRHAPLPDCKRVCAALADCIQISGCYGKVEICDALFSGAQDDPINIHGTYLGLNKINGKEITLRFCHGETWGFLPFQKGDEICPVKRSNFSRGESYFVENAQLVDETVVRLTLDRAFPETDDPDAFVIENLSANPDVSVHDCVFECYPTRGLLLSSAGKCRIYNNEFRQTAARPAIFISGDANNWYESGGVRDVEITGNIFRCFTVPAIEINPHVPEPDGTAVHNNIRIKDNIFENKNVVFLRYHSAGILKTDLPEDKIEKIGK